MSDKAIKFVMSSLGVNFILSINIAILLTLRLNDITFALLF